jgi:hypothetical protein
LMLPLRSNTSKLIQQEFEKDDHGESSKRIL